VPLLLTRNLSKRFGESRAVDDIDIAIEEGEFVSLIGSNGAGKTTLVNLISALLKPDAGTIFFAGRDITALSSIARIKIGIGRSFQLASLFDSFSALDTVALAILSRDGKSLRLGARAVSDTCARKEAREVLLAFGLAGKAGSVAATLAHGERKLLDVAVAFALRPKLLFLDEPTSGVSTRDKNAVMDTIAAVVRARGITTVAIEHDMDVVFKYSNRIIAMHQGKILADGSPDAIRMNQEVAANLLGAATTLQGANVAQPQCWN
jgi:branched-chain amino acid transport system ATP-binding protein